MDGATLSHCSRQAGDGLTSAPRTTTEVRMERGTMAMPAAPNPAVAAQTFRLDVKGAALRRALAAAGVTSVLIKGPTLARLLGFPPGVRDYKDVDLVVDPAQLKIARAVLRREGFRPLDPEAPSGQCDPQVARLV